MGRKPGRPKLPANVVRLTGNRSELTDVELEEREAEEIHVAPLRPTVPADLSPHARECWKRLAPELERLGLLTVLDAESFRLACETYALALYSLEEMRPKRADGEPDGRKRGYEILQQDTHHGGQLKRHAAFANFMQASTAFNRWCIDFGLSPSARASLRPSSAGAPSAAGAAAEDDDDFFGTGS